MQRREKWSGCAGVPSRVEHGDGAICVILQQGLFQRHTHRSGSGSEVKMTGGHHQTARPATHP